MTMTQTGWNLSDFDTAGWDTLEPCPGARIVRVYGVFHGEAFGRLVRKETTRWGTHWVVQMDDGTTTTMDGGYTGRAVAYPYLGETRSEEPTLRHETKGIGVYVVRVTDHGGRLDFMRQTR